jgi:antitoxin YefM
MTTMSLADAKVNPPELVARVSGQHEPVDVTVHGKPSAVLLAIEDLKSLEETIAILADADTMRRLHASEAELARGEVERRDELNADMGPPTQPTAVSEDQLDEPHRVGRQLRPPLGDRHSARRGTYRVIYRVDGETRTVTVLDVAHRRDATGVAADDARRLRCRRAVARDHHRHVRHAAAEGGSLPVHRRRSLQGGGGLRGSRRVRLPEHTGGSGRAGAAVAWELIPRWARRSCPVEWCAGDRAISRSVRR